MSNRRGGRRADQLRGLSISRHYARHAEGSALIECGQSEPRALAVIAAVYTATALVSSLYNIEDVLFRLGWNPAGQDWSLTSLPNVLLPAFVLLVAGAGAFTAQRHHRARA